MFVGQKHFVAVFFMNAKEARGKACLLFALYGVLCVKVLKLFLATVLPFEIRFLSTFLPSAALTSSKGSRIHWTAGGHLQLDKILSESLIMIHFAPHPRVSVQETD